MGGAVALAAWLQSVWNWGSTDTEQETTLPGDELVPEPAIITTRAVSIDASANEVWRWLVQIGQDRGGMYSYDWLENLVGLHIHSAEQIREEWQTLAVGDRIRLVPVGWLGMKEGLALPVERIDPPRYLVLREAPSETPWDAIWSFHTLPDDASHCRLVSRTRATRQSGLSRVAALPMDLVALAMTRRMLLGIKQRAERQPR